MKTSFELWDVEAANIVGKFTTKKEAIDVVAGLLDAYGPDYADELSLIRRTGDEPAQVVVEGEELLALATAQPTSLSEVGR